MSAESEQTLKEAASGWDPAEELWRLTNSGVRQRRRIHNLRRQVKGLERALAQARLLNITLRERARGRADADSESPTP